MGVRLNKVLTELNIGLQTAVDYLKNKKSLGEIKDDANMNTKINDEQYNALVKEFRGDKDVKTQAGMMFPKKKEKPKKEVVPEPVMEKKEESRQTFTPLGKIDLSQIGKPAVKEKPAPKPETEKKAEVPQPKPNTEPKSEPKPEPQPEPEPKPKSEPKPEPKPEPKEEAKPEPVSKPAPETPQVQDAPAAPAAAKEPEVFKLKTEQKAMPNLNVVGKIDLDSLNQSTRPKKKTKEERKKEREEKQAQMHGGNGEKKKRERIRGGKERVDIEAAVSQDKSQNNNNKKNKNKGGNQNFQDSNAPQSGGKNKKKNRPVKPLEVDDEAVARQVKETLARLTSKNQNKKGAKYRREKRDAVQERISEEMAAEAAQGHDDECWCQPGHRYLHEHWHHGKYQPTSGCRDHQYRRRRIRVHHRVCQRRGAERHHRRGG